MCFGCYPKPIYDRKLRQAEKGKKYSLDGKKFKAKVVDVYDGDTLTVVFRNRGQLEQHTVRMMGYDSPEMKPPKNQKHREKEIHAANRSREELISLCCNNGLVNLHCHEFDKYGRLLGTVYTQRSFIPWRKPINVNQYMINHQFGTPYDGGTKKQWTPQ